MLVDRETIINAREKIRKLKRGLEPVFGKFEPIYDINVPEKENSDVPYKIIGAKWIPADDVDDKDEITACMIMPPDRDYRNRYYQGTDPIASPTGHSMMASCIWDRAAQTEDGQTEAPVCYIYYRKQHDPKASYLQCLLMGLYYDTNHQAGQKQGVPELIENNIGISYYDYCSEKGFSRKIILNSEIAEIDLRGGGALWGLNTSGKGNNRRKIRVVYKLGELIKVFGQNIYFDTFWKELETYANVGKDGESWQPVDKKQYFDDSLDGTSFAKICSDSFPHLKTHKVEKQEIGKTERKTKMVRTREGKLIREYA
jgi:hypothetical protein